MAEFKMPRINKIMLAGRCTRNAEMKYVGENKTALCKIGIAVSETRKDKSESVVFIDVTVWGAGAEYAAKLKKGYPVYIEGKLVMDEWQDKTTGQTRRSININAFQCVGLTWDNENGTASVAAEGGNQREEMEPFMESGADLPF